MEEDQHREPLAILSLFSPEQTADALRLLSQTLMIGAASSRAVVAEIAVDIDMSDAEGSYDVPQAPWLTCYGESFYVRLLLLAVWPSRKS